MSEFSTAERRKAVARIVAAHLSHNKVPASGVRDVLEAVKTTVDNLAGPGDISVKRNPAVPVNRSVTPDYLICLEDGLKFKTLKRHLLSHYGLTPDEYRKKWGLHPEYPMVAPRYAEERSALAKSIGFGRRTSDRTKRRASRSLA